MHDVQILGLKALELYVWVFGKGDCWHWALCRGLGFMFHGFRALFMSGYRASGFGSVCLDSRFKI